METRFSSNDEQSIVYNENDNLTISCAGNACQDVSYRWNNGNFFKNNSSNRRIDVSLKNWVGGNILHLGPGQETKSFLEVFEDPYVANYV